MRFQVNIYTGNDAFKPDSGPELARLLCELAEKIHKSWPGSTQCVLDSTFSCTLFDINGNNCGTAKMILPKKARR